jgi:hypothetical protein
MFPVKKKFIAKSINRGVVKTDSVGGFSGSGSDFPEYAALFACST